MKQQKSMFKMRVKKAHSAAKFVGVLYLLGALAMLGFACLPALKVSGEQIWIMNFWEPFKNLFNSATRSYYDLLICVLYAFIPLTALINFFKCFSHLSWLSSKKSLKYVNGYNLNTEAMDAIGKNFSGSLAAFIIFHLLIYVLSPVGSVALTIWAYTALGVALFIHFVGGIVGGKISYFEESVDGYEKVEEKRSCSMFVYVFRNLVQIGAIVAILWYFLKVCNLYDFATTALSFKNPFTGGLMNAVLPFALKVVILICLMVKIKHATATTEFNHLGIEGSGMKNFRVFAFFTFLAAGGIFAVDYFVVKAQPVDYTFAIIAGIAFVAFLIDCIFKSRPKYEEAPMMDTPVATNRMERHIPYAQPIVSASQTVQQPIYVPVYYPMPCAPQVKESAPETAKPAPAPVAPPAPAPAPVTIIATPAPEAVQAKAKAEAKKRKAAEEQWKALNPNREFKVRCPQCARELSVKDASPYHRCPSCDKVFRLEKFQTYKPNPNYKPKKK